MNNKICGSLTNKGKATILPNTFVNSQLTINARSAKMHEREATGECTSTGGHQDYKRCHCTFNSATRHLHAVFVEFHIPVIKKNILLTLKLIKNTTSIDQSQKLLMKFSIKFSRISRISRISFYLK